MKAIIIAFTLKGQDFAKIKEQISLLSMKSGENTLLIHGFMPENEVLKRKFSTDVVDCLAAEFPVQCNMYLPGPDGGPLRLEMAEIGKKLDATVYVIGDAKEGVHEEVLLYEKAGLTITYIPLLN